MKWSSANSMSLYSPGSPLRPKPRLGTERGSRRHPRWRHQLLRWHCRLNKSNLPRYDLQVFCVKPCADGAALASPEPRPRSKPPTCPCCPPLAGVGPLAAGTCCAAGAAAEAGAACNPPPFPPPSFEAGAMTKSRKYSRPTDAQLGSTTNINLAKGKHLQVVTSCPARSQPRSTRSLAAAILNCLSQDSGHSTSQIDYILSGPG